MEQLEELEEKKPKKEFCNLDTTNEVNASGKRK